MRNFMLGPTGPDDPAAPPPSIAFAGFFFAGFGPAVEINKSLPVNDNATTIATWKMPSASAILLFSNTSFFT